MTTPIKPEKMARSDVCVFEMDTKEGVISGKTKLFEDSHLARHEGFWLLERWEKWTSKVDLYMNKRYMKMRRVLFEWLKDVVDVQIVTTTEKNMDILFLACEIFDKFVHIRKGICRSVFQGYGIACLVLAVKMCTDYDTFSLDEASWLTNRSSSLNQIKRYEIDILKALDYAVDLPTIADVLERTDLGPSQDIVADIEEIAFEKMVLEGYSLFVDPLTLAQQVFRADFDIVNAHALSQQINK
jgi:hypothetical protein